MFASNLLSLTLLITSATAAPHFSPREHKDIAVKLSGCALSNSLNLPANQTVLVKPTTTPQYVGLALGTQNYTCGATGTYTNVGALAELFDASCIVDSDVLGDVEAAAYDLWSNGPASITAAEVIAKFDGSPIILGQHFFVPNPIGSGLSPEWNFAQSGHSFVIGAKTGDLPSPDSPSDIDWLMLKSVEGSLASEIFRVDTHGGVAPLSCTPGSAEIAVRYSATYWLY